MNLLVFIFVGQVGLDNTSVVSLVPRLLLNTNISHEHDIIEMVLKMKVCNLSPVVLFPSVGSLM